MDIEELSVNLSSDDPAMGLRASLALRRLAERVEANHVASAREKGWSWQQIAERLYITPYTVKDHLKAIFKKVRVSTRGELVSQLAGRPASGEHETASAA